MLAHGVGKQGFEQGRTFGVLESPADDAAATDVEDDVEIEIPASASQISVATSK